MRWILYSSGNIPVDRKSKDRQILFKGTIDALSKGYAVALFPEGTSYTEPRIMQVKDGAAWSAMEYTKWAKENPNKAASKDVTIVPVSIVYTNKSKYRSCVSNHFFSTCTCDVHHICSRSSWSERFVLGVGCHKISDSHKLRFGTPITLDPYKEQFFSNEDGAARAAVKRLTRAIETEMIETSINAPDW